MARINNLNNICMSMEKMMLLMALSCFAGASAAQTVDSVTRQGTVALSEVTISQRTVRHEGGRVGVSYSFGRDI